MSTVKRWEEHTGDKKLPEKVKSAGAADFLRRMGKKVTGTLSGRNVREAVERWHPEVMKAPPIRRALKEEPLARPVINDYVTEVLHGRQPIPIEVFEKGPAFRRMVRNLEKGQEAVSKASRNKWLSRGIVTTGVAVPAAYAIKEAEKKEDGEPSIKEMLKTVVPVVAGLGLGAAPITQGIRSGALNVRGSDVPKQFKDVKDLQKILRPGDIVMTADPAKGDRWKAMVSSMGGDPEAYHVQTYVGKEGPKNKPQAYTIHGSPGYGGAYGEVGALPVEEDVLVRRFKDKATAKEYLKRVHNRALAEDAFNTAFGERARGNLYAGRQNVRSGIRSMLPEFLGKILKEKYVPEGTASCSSLTGQCSPVRLARGVEGYDVLPHHVRRSKELETVGQYLAPRSKARLKAYNAVYKAAPWLIRGAIGAGLGYGAYRGAKALTKD